MVQKLSLNMLYVCAKLQLNNCWGAGDIGKSLPLTSGKRCVSIHYDKTGPKRSEPHNSATIIDISTKICPNIDLVYIRIVQNYSLKNILDEEILRCKGHLPCLLAMHM
jgi:hypothetical protein